MKLENTWLLEVPEVQGFSANHLPPQKYPQNETSQTMILGDKGDWGTTIQILRDQGPPKKKVASVWKGLQIHRPPVLSHRIIFPVNWLSICRDPHQGASRISSSGRFSNFSKCIERNSLNRWKKRMIKVPP